MLFLAKVCKAFLTPRLWASSLSCNYGSCFKDHADGESFNFFSLSSQRLQPATSAHTSITFLSLRLHSLSLQVFFIPLRLSPPNLSLRSPLCTPPPHSTPPCRAAEARRLLSDHGAAKPALRHTLWPAPALRGADGSGVRAGLRGAGHAGRQGPRHWRRCACTWLSARWHMTTGHLSDLLPSSSHCLRRDGLIVLRVQRQKELTCSY